MIELEIKKRIDNYLGFDSDKIFKSCDLVLIFGGAIRDSIIGSPINDIDILVGSKSINQLENILLINGFYFIESLIPKDLASIYHDIQVISEPRTWMNGGKIVQLIKPRIANYATHPLGQSSAGFIKKSDMEYYKDNFYELISNVDLSCCGVSYDGNKLQENYTNAILHCKSKVFSVNYGAKMFSQKRIDHRIAKLEDRGWNRIDNTVLVNRDLKIKQIINS
jgi:hypothetical protein